MLQAAPWDTRSVTSQLVALVTYVKYLDFDLTINICKRRKRKGERDFEFESRYVKLCWEFRDFIRST